MQTQFTNGIRRNPSWRMVLPALFIALLTWVALPQAAWAATFTVTKPADTNDGACNADCSLREAIIAANAAPGADVITLPAGTYTLSRTGVDNSAANGDLDVTGPLTINGAGQGTTIIQAGSSGPTAIDRVFSFNPLGSATGFAVALNNLTIRNGKNPNAFATQENDGGCFDFDGGTTGAGSLSLTNVTVSNCETTDGSGGGAALFLPKGGTITFSGATIQNNIASRGGTNFGDGGGLIFSCVQSGGTATVTITNSTISGNSTRSLGGNNGGSGGGIVNFGVCTPGTATANMLLRAVTISNNSTGADGGGIFSGGALTIDNVGGPSVISNNSAGRSGGGIWLNHPNTTSTISKVTFSGNSAGDDGGAIRLGSSTPGNVLNVSFSRFVNNTASSGKASGLSVYNGNATATNNWWGCSTGPSAAPCDTAKLDPATGTTGPLGTGTLNVTPWLRVNVTAATNPLVTGQSTSLTASILTDSNGGAVALSNLTLLLGQPVAWSGVGGTISGQQTTIQANGTATANYQATAAAAGNLAVAKVDNDGTTTGSNVRSITVNKANTTVAITADTPDPSLFGQSVTVNYNVTVNSPGTGTPTGNVTVSDGVNSCTGTVAAGTCTIALSTVGARTLTATYASDANFNGSTSAGVAHTVNKANTTTTITSDTPDPSVVGQSVTVVFAVTASAPGAGTPTGNVTVSDGTSSCTGTVAAGQCNLTFTSVGSKSLTATYAGDTNFNGSTSTSAAHTVNKADTTTTITNDTPDPSTVGQAVTVNFSVAASAPGAGSPTGNVTVSDGVDSCTGMVAAGSCAITLTNAGNRTLTATYAGDSNFNGSISADESHIVNQNDTTTVITADNPDPSIVGQTVIVQYTVTPGTATGNVAITSDDGVDSCTGTVAAGQCILTFTSAGAKLLVATYVGDDNLFPSASDAAPHTVNPAATTTTITADTPDPSTVGQTVTVQFVVQVTAPGAGTPTGNVTVSDGVDSCTATVAAGQCTITLSTTGSRTLTATYAGDSNFTGSTSAGEAHTVNAATQAPTITTQPTNQSVCAGATASFSAAASGDPAPTVQWQVSSDNGATWNDLSGETNPTLNVDTSAPDNGKQYRALFSNSAGSATSNAATLTVNSAPTISTQPGNQTVNEGQSVSFSAAASGSPAPTVQWQVSSDNGATWSDLSGETAATLTFTAQSSDNGKQYRAIFTNSCGTATTNAATLTVNTLPPPDTTAPVITPSMVGTLGNNGWYVSDVTVSWSVVDNESTISSQSGCDPVTVNADTAGVTFTCSATSSGGSSSESVTIKRDAIAPVVTVTGVSDGASYTVGSVPTAACSTTDALSGVATQATVSVTGGNPDGTGSFTATCSGATDNAGNSAVPVSVSYTVSALVDVCTTTALRDDFNRANGGLGSKWAGLTNQSFYKIAGNRVDVQLGGPVVWKPTTFGVNQAAFVTLSTLDPLSPAQGVLLKVQSGTIPNAGAIAVVYDGLAKAVRVSTLRLNTPAWATYSNTPATFANGDKLLGCVQADGTVRVYQNNSLLTTVTLNAADQSFFNTKGGKIGLWTVAAPNAFFDDFGGGALDGVSAADTTADTAADVASLAENAQTNLIFLPVINR
ncbi:MAG: Ig-like domain repeat protein [Caldilineaceae bacterium]